MASTLNASSSGSGGLIASGDASGVLQLQSNGVTTATVDTSGNLGLGVTPSAWGTGFKAFENQGGALYSGSTSAILLGQNFYYNGTNNIYKTTNFASAYSQNSGVHTWLTAPSGTAGNTITFTQAMTLDVSGQLGIGTGGFGSGFTFSISSGIGNQSTGHASGSASGSIYNYFTYNNGVIGSITQNGTTGVLYNLTSDYRLKNNQEALTGAKDFIMALKPKKWQWWDGSGEGVGFVAHEFMDVAKHSGHGEKDAVETIEIKDEDGNVTGTEERPVYQSIQPSSSEVMANLVSLIQEQQALIETLTARMAQLESKL